MASAYRVQQQRVIKQAATIRRLRRLVKRMQDWIEETDTGSYGTRLDLFIKRPHLLKSAAKALAETA